MKNFLSKLSIYVCLVVVGVFGTLITMILVKADFSGREDIEVTNEQKEVIEEVLHTNEEVCLIEKFGNPVSEKYMPNISSHQGFRSEIELDAGGTAGRTYHNAIDIVMPEGTRINATKSGIVTNVYPSYYNGGAKYKGHPIYGGLVEIQHPDGTKTLYGHLSLTLVKEGDEVLKGQKIGESGGVAGKRGSGLSTGPHLHYSIMLDLNTFVAKL